MKYFQSFGKPQREVDMAKKFLFHFLLVTHA